MNAKTLAALNDGIRKWDANAEVERLEDAKTGSVDCLLCHLFIFDRCVACPVKQFTGRSECWGTPYYDAALAKWLGDLSAFHTASSAMAAFLRTLLPEGETE